MPQRDRLASFERIENAKTGQRFFDWRIELQLTLLDELHGGNGVEQFRNRCRAEHCVLGHWNVLRLIGHSVTRFKNRFTIDKPSDRRAIECALAITSFTILPNRSIADCNFAVFSDMPKLQKN